MPCRLVLAVVCVATVSFGCDLFEPEFPDLAGRYGATWSRSFLTEEGFNSFPPDCSGTITIHEANDSLFSGSYVIPPGQPCFVESGSIEGELRRDGGVTFNAGERDLALSGCSQVGGSWVFNGAFLQRRLTAQQAVRATCEASDSTTVTGTLRTSVVAEKR